MPRALITGNAGFVGWHFEQYLQKGGWQTYGVDINGANRWDARDMWHWDNIRHFDLVVHCAAVVGGRKTIDGAPLALASNLELDAGLFQWALRNKPGRILYFSSSAAYPVYDQNTYKRPLKENRIRPELDAPSVGSPDQLYGWAKLIGENLAHRYREEGGHVSVVRPFSGYGETQSDTYPFMAMVQRALRGDDPFEVWGDGTQTRDFIHIDDIVSACWNMVQQEINGPVNLGWGRATTMDQLARMCMTAAGYSASIVHRLEAPRGVGYRVADVTALTDFYSPMITLEQGIRRAFRRHV